MNKLLLNKDKCRGNNSIKIFKICKPSNSSSSNSSSNSGNKIISIKVILVMNNCCN